MSCAARPTSSSTSSSCSPRSVAIRPSARPAKPASRGISCSAVQSSRAPLPTKENSRTKFRPSRVASLARHREVLGFPGECGTSDAAAGRDSMRETEAAAQALGIDNALRTLLGTACGTGTESPAGDVGLPTRRQIRSAPSPSARVVKHKERALTQTLTHRDFKKGTMPDKSPKTKAELEALVLAELRALSQCDGVVHVT